MALLSSLPVINGDEDKTTVVSTTLTAIRQTPESYKGVWVTFPVQFSSVGRLQNPFFTRFVASDFLNFYVWADEQPIWQREEYDDVFGLMFLSKENQGLERLVGTERYDRLQVTGVVRNTFQGMPWIEVNGFEPLGSAVDPATLSHMYRGEQHMLNRDWVKAIAELSLAPVEGTPNHVQAAVHRNLGVCHLRLGESDTAKHHLETATMLAKADSETKRLIHTAENNPSLGLDRDIDRESVRDAERPLWEAFAPAHEPSAPMN